MMNRSLTVVRTVPGTEKKKQEQQATWARCSKCDSLVYGKRLGRNLKVCPDCGFHHRLTAPERIGQLFDPDTFVPLPARVRSVDFLGFTDTIAYPVRLEGARKSTGLQDAVRCGSGRISGRPVVAAVMDFRFMGGSLGAAVGELITRAAEEALRVRWPLLLVTASGGARMQEGVLSLMQMAKTSQAVAALREAGILTVSLITDPTYGGVAASYATNTDVLIAETGARMGFAGPRVIKQTIRQDLPPGFQTAEFLLECGQVDLVAGRRDLRGVLGQVLAAGHRRRGSRFAAELAAQGPAIARDPEALPEVDPWQVVQRARHIGRPTTLEHTDRIFDSFIELHGDRIQGDCAAIVAGLAQLDGHPLVVVGHQKGHNARELAARNFGMPRPEGYRKALRVMRLAASLGLPVVTFVDTPGAYPGTDAEKGGQASAIAGSVLEMSGLPVPVVTVVTGEGGSGGALALAVADQVLITENGFYSVISPEGCSAILWNDAADAPRAARALRVTAPELLRLGVADGVVPEPPGGSHDDPAAASALLRAALLEALGPLLHRNPADLIRDRRRRFRAFGESVSLDESGELAADDDGQAA
jgi:acyl-CoA carboxylase subunit beta